MLRHPHHPDNEPYASTRRSQEAPSRELKSTARARFRPETGAHPKPCDALAKGEERAPSPAVGPVLLAAQAQAPTCVSRRQSRSESPLRPVPHLARSKDCRPVLAFTRTRSLRRGENGECLDAQRLLHAAVVSQHRAEVAAQ